MTLCRFDSDPRYQISALWFSSSFLGASEKIVLKNVKFQTRYIMQPITFTAETAAYRVASGLSILA